MAQALVTLDAGTGSAIFTILSCRHSLHLQGRFRTDVFGRIFSSLPLPHLGQIAHPSLTSILPQDCNKSNSFSCKMKENILTPKTEKNRKAYSFLGFRLRFFARFGFLPDSGGSRYLIQL